MDFAQEEAKIEAFLAQKAFAVVGASANRAKYGNKVLRVYLQHERTVFAVNPAGGEIEGVTAYADVAALPPEVGALSIVTPPAVTREVVRAALRRGIQHFWLQPGAEDATAIAEAEEAGASVVHGGACVLVVLGYRD